MRLPLRRTQAATADPSVEALPGTHSVPTVLGAAAGLLIVGWLLVKGADDVKLFTTVTLNGITLSALFFVVASGFTLIFGLMRVVNMAHGSLYLLGGYLAFEMQKDWFAEETQGLNLSLASPTGSAGEYDLLGWLLPVVLAALVIGVVGVIIEQLFLRWNQGQDLRQALITIAISRDHGRPDARAVRRHLQGRQDTDELARERDDLRRSVRLLPPGDRHRLRAADWTVPVVADQAHPLRADRARGSRRPRDGLGAGDQHPARVRRPLSSSARRSPASVAPSAARCSRSSPARTRRSCSTR